MRLSGSFLCLVWTLRDVGDMNRSVLILIVSKTIIIFYASVFLIVFPLLWLSIKLHGTLILRT